MGYLHKTEQECKKSKVFIKSNVHNNSVHNLSMIENGKKVRRKRV